ncbi:MAG TPA: DUF5996 family protein [Anaerolineaceae bacterium]|nr:DUF5996 family protein [Anaerolineaceae bacterium]
MAIPKLVNWQPTASGLHQGARLLGAVQQLTQEPQPAYLELGLRLTGQSLATGLLPSGGRLILDFLTFSLVFQGKDQESETYQLNGYTQAQVFNSLFGDLANADLRDLLPPGKGLFERVSAGILSRGRYRLPEKGLLLDESPIQIDPQNVRNYLTSLQMVYTGLARMKATLTGMQTPLVVWPHGLDLSTLWFTGNEIDENQPHMNFGYSPRSEGLPDPYYYAYAYPFSGSEAPAPLPEGARWHTQGWQGILAPYDLIAAQPDPADYIEKISQIIFELLLPFL